MAGTVTLYELLSVLSELVTKTCSTGGWDGPNIHALWVGGLGVALVAFDKAMAGRGRSADAAGDEVLSSVVTALAVQIERWWTGEAVLLQVERPAPAVVPWSSTSRIAASRQAVLDATDGADWQHLPLQGDATTIVDAFLRLPHRQMMVLGQAGAGKGVLAMLLTLGLIRRRDPTLPVPVLLSINAWDPARETVARFVTGTAHGELVFAACRSWGSVGST